MDNSAFLQGINEKNEKAWEELYRYYYASLCSYAEKMLGETGLAEDVVQDCLIRMWHAPAEFTEVKALTAWLYKTVYHAAVSVLREKKCQSRLQEGIEIPGADDEEQGKEMALREEIVSRFYDILYQMPRQQRDVLMCCLEGMKVHEIADKLHISENSVKTHKKRAYLFVREHFDIPAWQVLLIFSWEKWRNGEMRFSHSPN